MSKATPWNSAGTAAARLAETLAARAAEGVRPASRRLIVRDIAPGGMAAVVELDDGTFVGNAFDADHWPAARDLFAAVLQRATLPAGALQ